MEEIERVVWNEPNEKKSTSNNADMKMVNKERKRIHERSDADANIF